MKFTKPFLLSGLLAALVIGGLVLYGVSRNTAPTAPPTPAPAPQPTPAPAPAPEPAPPASATKAYSNAKFGFSVTYPDSVTPTEDKQAMNLSGYIPVCDPEVAVVCFPIGKAPYAGKNFENAAFAVHVQPTLKTETSCGAAGNGEQADGSATIGGLAYRKFSFGDSAMGHHLEGENYRAFRNGTCFELSTRIGTTNFDNYPAGTIERFTDQDRADVEHDLETMLFSFRFN